MQRKILYWEDTFNEKGISNSPFFLTFAELKKLKNYEIDYMFRIKDFTKSYLMGKPLCGRNKISFEANWDEAELWHYHIGEYDNILLNYEGKKCFSNYKLDIKKSCSTCKNFTENFSGLTSKAVIHYIKFDENTIGIAGYALEHSPFLQKNEDIVKKLKSLKMENFIEI